MHTLLNAASVDPEKSPPSVLGSLQIKEYLLLHRIGDTILGFYAIIAAYRNPTPQSKDVSPRVPVSLTSPVAIEFRKKILAYDSATTTRAPAAPIAIGACCRPNTANAQDNSATLNSPRDF